MSNNSNLPYGSWPSPISAQQVVEANDKPVELALQHGNLYWLQLKAEEDGRISLITRQGESEIELTPAPYSARSRIHEYGGGALLVAAQTIFFVHGQDQDIHQCSRTNGAWSAPTPLTAEPHCRYGDFCLDSQRNRLICVRENHQYVDPEYPYPENELVAIDLSNGQQRILQHQADFYAAPRISPCGQQLCWLSWDHPHMPWDSSYLNLAALTSDGNLRNHQIIAGGESESVLQPEWDCQSRLHFISDRNGWWNIYRHHKTAAINLSPRDREFGRPPWALGQRTYAINQNQQIAASYFDQGEWFLALLTAGKVKTIAGPYADIKSLCMDEKNIHFIASFSDRPDCIISLDLASHRSVHKSFTNIENLQALISVPQNVRFKSKDQTTVQGFLYLPKSTNPSTDINAKPPLIIKTHGGPTACTYSSLDLSIQFWTSRGFAVFDINYRGSSGFGRQFRQKLYGHWGKFDVEDCIAAAEFLMAKNVVNPQQLIIRGHSAGGFTTLCALTFSNRFNAGASLYGICDLERLSAQCHKFESHYVEQLIGLCKSDSRHNLSKSDAQKNPYKKSSPLFSAQQLSCPVIFFQGLKDKVVPPNQSQLIFQQLKSNHIATAYMEFPEEGHGFRRAENITACLNAELYFYRKIFNLPDPENLAPLTIANL